MNDVDFYHLLYKVGYQERLFKSVSPEIQKLKVADFSPVSGSPDIHLTYDSTIKGEYNKHKNLHLTVRYRGAFASEVNVINNIRINSGDYKKNKSAPSLVFYLIRSKDKNGKESLQYNGGNKFSDTKVNVDGYIARLNHLIVKNNYFLG